MGEKETGPEKRCAINHFLSGNFGADHSGIIPRPAAGRQVFDLPLSETRLIFTQRIDNMPAGWDELVPPGKLFFERSYLRLLESAPPQRMTFGYLLFQRRHRPVGIALLQFADFEGASALLHLDPSTSGDDSWIDFFKKKIAAALRFRVMICGNMLLSGEHGFHFCGDVGTGEVVDLLAAGLERLAAYFRQGGEPVQATLIKDVAARHEPAFSEGLPASFNQFVFQPSMEFIIPGNWESFDHYLENLTSKYRVRLRRARKKAAGIERRPLNYQEILGCQQYLRALYQQVVDTSAFNMVELADNYFQEFKGRLPENFQLYGYFQGAEMVGFATTIANGNTLEAHFLGFDNAVNRSSQLYLNMLYDIIGDGIDQKKEKIIFARTAMEIKSSVGALPHDYYVYFRHHTPWFNGLVPRLVRFLQPDCKWTPRHPFR